MTSYRMLSLSKTPTKFMQRKFEIDIERLDCSRVNTSSDKRSQTSSNFWTEQKATNSYLYSPETTSFVEETNFKRIDLTLDKYKFSNTYTKPSSFSTKKFDDLHEKINSHLNKISQFLSNNKTGKQNSIYTETESVKEDIKPEPHQEYSYLRINKKPEP